MGRATKREQRSGATAERGIPEPAAKTGEGVEPFSKTGSEPSKILNQNQQNRTVVTNTRYLRVY